MKGGYVWISAALFISGCSLQPRYERPAAPISGSYPIGEAYQAVTPKATSVAGTAQTELPAAEIGWRDFLADPQLQRLVEIALANNRDLRAAALRVAQVQAQYRIQRAQLFPQLNADAGATRFRSSAAQPSTGQAFVGQTYSAELSATWVLDFFGRLNSLREQALEQYFATAYARQATEILLVAQVANQYLLMLADDELLAVTRDTLKTAQDSFELTKLQFEVGTANELAMRQAEGVLEQASANYAAYVRLRAQDENVLVQLLGQPLPAGVPGKATLDSQKLLTDIPAGLPSELLSRRPDILQAEAVLRASNANIGAARAAFFPDISLTGTLGSVSPQLSGLFKGGTLAWSVSPQLIQPIFNAGSNRATLDLSKLQKDIDIASYEKAIQIAFREVADGLAARGTYDEQVARLQKYVATQKIQLDLSLLRYQGGIDSYLNVLTAQNSYYAARQSLVSARLNRLINLVNLYQALGGGWIARTGDAPRPADVPLPPEWSPTFLEGKSQTTR